MSYWHVLGIIGLVLLGIVILAAILGPFFALLDGASRAWLLISLIGVLAAAGYITWLGNEGAFEDDSPSHCAEGTHYVSSYNSSTESTDWWCVAGA